MSRRSSLSPETALALIPGLPRQRQLSAMSGGLSNQVWRVDTPNGRYLLRLHNPKPAAGIDRQAERHSWQLAAAAGIAPELCYWDSEHRFSLCRYLSATPLQQPEPQAVAALLAAFHPLPPLTAERRDYAGLARQALAVLAGADAQLQQWTALADHWQQLVFAAGPAVGLCHHDPTAGNLLCDGERLWLVDFEYACAGAPLFDLAAAGEWWSAPLRAELLAHYGQLRGLTPSPALDLAYAAGYALHQLLALLWWLALPPRVEIADACERYRRSLVAHVAAYPLLVAR